MKGNVIRMETPVEKVVGTSLSLQMVDKLGKVLSLKVVSKTMHLRALLSSVMR